jgi:hypothetical protein
MNEEDLKQAFSMSEEDLRRAQQLADDARRMTTTVASFHPTDKSFVEICYGPAPFDKDVSASGQPRAYTIYWLADPSERVPERDEWVAAEIFDEENGVLMFLWVVFERLDVIHIVKKQWGREIAIPVVRVLS